MQSNNVYSIKVEDLGKTFKIYKKPQDRLKQKIFGKFKRYFTEFVVFENLNFSVKKGETVGIIGRNGAGKSTLLQIICGTLIETKGSIFVEGRVAALLELGAGFNPDFTGRENIYMAASLYGLSKAQVDKKFERILDFAEIGNYIDQPVKKYSSGMFVRLAFSLIAHVDADVLIIDEALSVGDIYFQQKCMRFLNEFRLQGGTLLFVSHDMAAVASLCDRCLLLTRKNGTNHYHYGEAKSISKIYLEDFYESKVNTAIEPRDRKVHISGAIKNNFSLENVNQSHFTVSSFNRESKSFGTGFGEIIDVYFIDSTNTSVSEFKSGEALSLVVRCMARKPMIFPAIGFILKNRLGQMLIAESTDTYFRSQQIEINNGDVFEGVFNFSFPRIIRGDYVIDIAFAEGPGDDHIQHHWIHEALVMSVADDCLIQGVFSDSDFSIKVNIK